MGELGKWLLIVAILGLCLAAAIDARRVPAPSCYLTPPESLYKPC